MRVVSALTGALFPAMVLRWSVVSARSVFLALLALFSSGCATISTGVRTKGLNATEKMMWSTYLVATTEGMATAFAVSRKDPSSKRGVTPVLITSVHVLKTAGKGPVYLFARMPGKDGTPDVAILQLQGRNRKLPFYVRHPHHDIAAFSLPLPDEISELVLVPSFLEESAIGASRKPARAGEDVCFVGYPEVLPGTPGAFPVLRAGRVASLATGHLRDQRKFLINADVYPGDSGSPVFATTRGGKPRLIGMIVERIGPDPETYVPLALAVDAQAVRETLQLQAQRERGVASAPSSAGARQLRP